LRGLTVVLQGIDSIAVSRVEAEKEASNVEKTLNDTRKWLRENKVRAYLNFT